MNARYVMVTAQSRASLSEAVSTVVAESLSVTPCGGPFFINDGNGVDWHQALIVVPKMISEVRARRALRREAERESGL